MADKKKKLSLDEAKKMMKDKIADVKYPQMSLKRAQEKLKEVWSKLRYPVKND